MAKTKTIDAAAAFDFISGCCPIFAGMDTDNFIKSTGGSVTLTEHAAGDVLISPDVHFGAAIGIIYSGTASVYSADTVHSVLLRRLGRGGVYGVAALFSTAPPPTRIIADQPCAVLTLPRHAVRAMLAADPTLLDAYLEFLSGRILFLNEKIACVTGGSAERRLAVHLLTLADDGDNGGDIPHGGNTTLRLGVSYTELARQLDIGRASLYRALDSLEAAGAIKREPGRSITIDRDLLSAMAATAC